MLQITASLDGCHLDPLGPCLLILTFWVTARLTGSGIFSMLWSVNNSGLGQPWVWSTGHPHSKFPAISSAHLPFLLWQPQTQHCRLDIFLILLVVEFQNPPFDSHSPSSFLSKNFFRFFRPCIFSIKLSDYYLHGSVVNRITDPVLTLVWTIKLVTSSAIILSIRCVNTYHL